MNDFKLLNIHYISFNNYDLNIFYIYIYTIMFINKIYE